MKHQNSYSFFCCYCEEPRRKERNNQQKRVEESSQISKIYKIDTNSNFSEKIVQQSETNDKKKEIETEKENVENNISENIKSIDSYHTMNNKTKNVIKPKKEDMKNFNNYYKNFEQNDINSFKGKKDRSDISLENLSEIVKKFKKDNLINTNIIQKEKNEEKEEQRKDSINKDNKENLPNIIYKNDNKEKDDIKTCDNKINNIYSNQNLVNMNEKENIISQKINKNNKFEFEENTSQEHLLWKNKSKNSNIINNQSNIIKNNNIIDISNNISNKSISNEINNDKDTNPINKVNKNINNEITYQKEKIEHVSRNDLNDNAKLKKFEKENKTLYQKDNLKLSFNNNHDNNSFNTAVEFKANINNIETNLINKNQIMMNQNKKEISANKEEILNKELNEVNNFETQHEIDKTNVYESQSLSQNGNNNDISIKEGINIKLNYLTEFCPTKPNQEEKKEMELKNSKSKRESVSEEIEDEVGSIDEFNNSNDNRSILSSYIFTSVRPTESNKSYASSIYGRSDSQDIISNYNEIMSSKGIRIFPIDMNNSKEVEIKMDNLHKNSKNYFISMQMNQIKKLKEKISDKEKIIKNNYNHIERYKKEMEKMEVEGRQYERWIEKEEEENEHLLYLLNFLIECK